MTSRVTQQSHSLPSALGRHRQIVQLEEILKKAIYQKGKGVSEVKTLESTFKQFDVDKSGEVSFKEFRVRRRSVTEGNRQSYGHGLVRGASGEASDGAAER